MLILMILYVWLIRCIPYLFWGFVAWLLVYIVKKFTARSLNDEQKYPRRIDLSWSLALFVILIWPFTVSRAVFETDCRLFDGFKLKMPIDARDNGYLIKDGLSQFNNVGRSAIYDLTSGRIAFFEIHNASEGYVQYYLTEAGGNKGCIEYTPDYFRPMKLPTGYCLASRSFGFQSSNYEFIGSDIENAWNKTASAKIVDRKSSRVISSVRSVALARGAWTELMLLNYHGPSVLKCSANSAPLISLTAATFIDKNGAVISPDFFEDMQRRNDAYPPVSP